MTASTVDKSPAQIVTEAKERDFLQKCFALYADLPEEEATDTALLGILIALLEYERCTVRLNRFELKTLPPGTVRLEVELATPQQQEKS